MNQEITKILRYDSESSNLDFKKEQYLLGKDTKRNELLKDISSFANHHSSSVKYIFVGIKEKDGVADEFFTILNPVDEAGYQQFVLEYIEPKINFEYRIIDYDGFNIGYFKIFGNSDRPYLFKKDVKNPITDKLEYRTGDGYIRIGTTTKKLDRNDLDIIYQSKFTLKDRKDDLIIRPYINSSTDEELSVYKLKYLDVEIINNSNKSIDIDVEMKVYKNENYNLTTKYKFIKELRKNKNKSMSGFGRSAQMLQTIQMIQPPNLQINFSEQNDFVIISRNRLAKRTSISLPQNSFEIDVFDQYLCILENGHNEVKAEIIIRSDDFTEGALVKELMFET